MERVSSNESKRRFGLKVVAGLAAVATAGLFIDQVAWNTDKAPLPVSLEDDIDCAASLTGEKLWDVLGNDVSYLPNPVCDEALGTPASPTDLESGMLVDTTNYRRFPQATLQPGA